MKKKSQSMILWKWWAISTHSLKDERREMAAILLVLLLCLSVFSSASCPSSASSLTAITTLTYTFNSLETFAYKSVSGPVSKNMYYLDKYSDSSEYGVVRRIDSSGSQIWMKAIRLTPDMRSLAVDSTEQNIYFCENSNPLKVIILSASDGSINSRKQL